MTLTLAIGATDALYQGATFNSGQELLINIRDYLLSLNWLIITDTATILKVKGTTTNGHPCNIIFAINIQTNYQSLVVYGDLDGTETYLSPELHLAFNLGQENKVWLIGDNDSCGICLRNFHTYSGGVFCGFLNRFDETDQFAWMIAYANNKLNDAYVARSKHLNTIWHRIGDSYFNADVFSSTTLNGAYQGIWDFVIAIALGSFTSLTILNAAYYAHNGRTNGVNDLSLITQRWYIEGEENTSNYSETSKFYCRGFIKHFYNGFGELSQGALVTDEFNQVYLTVGDNGWQGLQIVQETEKPAPILYDLPCIFHGGNDGISIGSQLRFISEIRNILTQLGWQLLVNSTKDNGDHEILLQGSYYDTDNRCYIAVSYNNITSTISIQGEVREDPDVSGIKSPSFEFQFIDRIWITANAQAGCVTIESAGEITSIYFGFYGGRIELSDRHAWGIGVIGGDLQQMYVAQSFYDKTYWRSIGSMFSSSSNSRSSFPAIATGDRLTTPLIPINFFNFRDGRNSAQNADVQGNINYATGETQLDFYAVIEGRDDPFSYGANAQFEQKPKQLFYRGYIQFACVGKQGGSGEAIFKHGIQIA